MTRDGVTEDLVHALVTDSHSQGIIDLYVAAAVEHRGQALLVASDDELDPCFELPSTAVLPGERLLDALCRCLAQLGLNVAQFSGYLGDLDRGDDGARAFCFAVTATDPNAVCRARISHEWLDVDDWDRFPPSARPHLIELSAWPPMPTPVRSSFAQPDTNRPAT